MKKTIYITSLFVAPLIMRKLIDQFPGYDAGLEKILLYALTLIAWVTAFAIWYNFEFEKHTPLS